MADSDIFKCKTYAEFEQQYRAGIEQALKQELEAHPELQQSGTGFPVDLEKAWEQLDLEKAWENVKELQALCDNATIQLQTGAEHEKVIEKLKTDFYAIMERRQKEAEDF